MFIHVAYAFRDQHRKKIKHDSMGREPHQFALVHRGNLVERTPDLVSEGADTCHMPHGGAAWRWCTGSAALCPCGSLRQCRAPTCLIYRYFVQRILVHRDPVRNQLYCVRGIDDESGSRNLCRNAQGLLHRRQRRYTGRRCSCRPPPGRGAGRIEMATCHARPDALSRRARLTAALQPRIYQVSLVCHLALLLCMASTGDMP